VDESEGDPLRSSPAVPVGAGDRPLFSTVEELKARVGEAEVELDPDVIIDSAGEAIAARADSIVRPVSLLANAAPRPACRGKKPWGADLRAMAKFCNGRARIADTCHSSSLLDMDTGDSTDPEPSDSMPELVDSSNDELSLSSSMDRKV
jgi:hypothetical protein